MSENNLRIKYRAIRKGAKGSANGGIHAALVDGSDTLKTKMASFGSRTPEAAYDIIEFWAEEIAQETGAIIERTSLAELLVLVDQPLGSGSRIPYIFDSKANFVEACRQVVEVKGVAYVRELIKDAQDKMTKDEKRRIEQEKRQDAAFKEVAQALYNAKKATGVDMANTITDDRVLAHYNELCGA